MQSRNQRTTTGLHFHSAVYYSGAYVSFLTIYANFIVILWFDYSSLILWFLCCTVAQHFIQVGTLEVPGVRLQVTPAHRPNIHESEQHSIGTSETAIPLSPVVEVSWSHANLSKEMLHMYLENRKRSGGGQVKDLRFFAEKWKAYVTFVDAQCKLWLCSNVESFVTEILCWQYLYLLSSYAEYCCILFIEIRFLLHMRLIHLNNFCYYCTTLWQSATCAVLVLCLCL